MRRILALFLGFVFSAILFFSEPDKATAGTSESQIESMVEKGLTVINDPTFSKKEKHVLLRAIFLEYFDAELMAERSLGKYAREYRSRVSELAPLLVELLDKRFLSMAEAQADELRHTKVEYLRKKVDGDRAEVATRIITYKYTFDITFILFLKNGIWKIVDIEGEGIRFISNYRAQFVEILDKNRAKMSPDEAFNDLLRRAKEKIL